MVVSPAGWSGTPPSGIASAGWWTSASGGVWRLRPWALEGRRLAVHAEGVRLTPGPLDRERLRAALAGGEPVRIARTLLAPGEPA